jgi:hypothetical protein
MAIMADSTGTSLEYAHIQRRVDGLENKLPQQGLHRARAVSDLMQLAALQPDIEHDPVNSPQSGIDATRLHLGTSLDIDTLIDQIERAGRAGILDEAIEDACGLYASNAPSSASMH